MSKVKAFAIDGLQLWFPSNDHEPPHFHAKRSGEWEVRVRFMLNDDEIFEMKWLKTSKTKIAKRHTTVIIEMVNAHRRELLEEWERIHS